MQTGLEVGKIIHLNSGSPDLKIVSVQGEEVTVEWNSESGVEQKTFPTHCLR
jgi:uncharacterized protein YodC (DUF2158 family)